ncbi:vacuolar cation/proton exchanger 2-like isoform X1 [Olea europaea var. sylvestris]|uniref:vacuolar cation/proton exchanger 2-like isoform X1 n=1 Tax=Olea europaea var. sylvestris TaxID=158386 RepID=UPI000C1D2821|nr:vacuolar cation/proton exchanger 2-like isoform X1 [Olea europaea var. sylvestris]XP_022843867.1 vacuolar cation/proton exchanger 2-like isoform X1 [Olea europaea var. sylvestris]XP_022843868.1 vacuolar cation/proton exchanger 2-like isoform X1 [Olea europaea var. sylvestris]
MIRGIQQSLLGSILADMLLVLGCALFFGGLVHRQKEQRFSKVAAHMTSALSLMAFMGILFPSVLQFTHTQMHTLKSELALSRISSCIILIGYGSFLFFQIKSKPILYISVDEAKDNGEEDSDEEEPREITQWEAIGWVAILTCWMSVLSAYLGDRIQEVSDSMNMQVGYISVILIPSVRNASEHASAVMFAMKDKLDLTLGVAIGSSTQISMFVIPFFAVAGWIVGKPMDLNFHVFETTILLTTVLVVAFMLQALMLRSWIQGSTWGASSCGKKVKHFKMLRSWIQGSTWGDSSCGKKVKHFNE